MNWRGSSLSLIFLLPRRLNQAPHPKGISKRPLANFASYIQCRVQQSRLDEAAQLLRQLIEQLALHFRTVCDCVVHARSRTSNSSSSSDAVATQANAVLSAYSKSTDSLLQHMNHLPIVAVLLRDGLAADSCTVLKRWIDFHSRGLALHSLMLQPSGVSAQEKKALDLCVQNAKTHITNLTDSLGKGFR